ncbi:MAG TPA: tetratricopeptide repeat protein, partial [Gemmataceae bacterium]|nr:tetratricopeptide repeat protein [Gemmataceae bacterium]
ALEERNQTQPPERQVRIRIGIHLGDVVHSESDVQGDGVNIAARIEPLAEPGGICISNSVYDQIENKVSQRLVRLSRPELKNIQASVQVYKLVLDGERIQAPAPANRSLVVALGLLVLVAAGFLLFLKFGTASKPAASARNAPPAPAGSAGADTQKSIAVLPFVNMSADKTDEYLSDGMTEELLNVLAKVPGLRVPGRTSCFAFKGRNEEGIFREVGERLRVGTVLEGSVRKAGDKLRVTAQLINVADGYHLWSEDYDGDMKDILTFESDVAQRVVQALQVKLGVEEMRVVARQPTEDPEANRLYLLGRHHAFKETEDDSKKAVEYFNQALQKDSNYARAYCGLADTLGDWKAAPREYFPRLRTYAQTALKLDPLLAEAHYSMAEILFYADWNFTGAEKVFGEALRLNPNLPFAHDGYAAYLVQLGRIPAAEAEQKKAVELDPLSPYTTADLAWVYVFARDFNKAIESARQAMEVDPNYPWSYATLSLSLILQGKPAEAIPQGEKMLSLADNPWSRLNLACAYAAAGDRAKAEAMLKPLDDLATRQFVSPYSRAWPWALMKEKDRALELLERAVAERDPSCLNIKVDPALDGLRREPRFLALLKKMAFPE